MNNAPSIRYWLLFCLVVFVLKADGGEERVRNDLSAINSLELVRIDKLLDGGSWRYEFVADGGRAMRIIPRMGLTVERPDFLVAIDKHHKRGGRFSSDADLTFTHNDNTAKVLCHLLVSYSRQLQEGDLRRERVLYLIDTLKGNTKQGIQTKLTSGGWETY